MHVREINGRWIVRSFSMKLTTMGVGSVNVINDFSFLKIIKNNL